MPLKREVSSGGVNDELVNIPRRGRGRFYKRGWCPSLALHVRPCALQMEIGRDPSAISRTIPTYLQSSPPSGILSIEMTADMSEYQMPLFLDYSNLSSNGDLVEGRKKKQICGGFLSPHGGDQFPFRDQRTPLTSLPNNH